MLTMFLIVVKIIFASMSAYNTCKKSSKSFVLFLHFYFPRKKNVSYMIHWAVVHEWAPATTQQSLVIGGEAVAILVEAKMNFALDAVGK